LAAWDRLSGLSFQNDRLESGPTQPIGPVERILTDFFIVVATNSSLVLDN
jgi:hypothetical protein